jgi:hypothetical protein
MLKSKKVWSHQRYEDLTKIFFFVVSLHALLKEGKLFIFLKRKTSKQKTVNQTTSLIII